METLKKFWGLFIPFAFIVVAIILSQRFALKSEKMLDKFARGKEYFGFLLSGQVVGQPGDTIYFDFISAVSFPIGNSYDPENQDHIIVVSAGKRYEFYRQMRNIWDVPNPCGNGKAMTDWIGVTKPGFAAFKKIIKNGTIKYDWAKNPEENFLNFGYSPEEAKKLANKVSRPLFAFKGNPESGKSNTLR